MGEPRCVASLLHLYKEVPHALKSIPFLLLSYLERGSVSGAAYEERSFSTIRTPSCCWIQVFASAASLDLEPGGHRLLRTCVELRGATRVALEVRLLPLHDLEVGVVGFINNAYAGA